MTRQGPLVDAVRMSPARRFQNVRLALGEHTKRETKTYGHTRHDETHDAKILDGHSGSRARRRIVVAEIPQHVLITEGREVLRIDFGHTHAYRGKITLPASVLSLETNKREHFY